MAGRPDTTMLLQSSLTQHPHRALPQAEGAAGETNCPWERENTAAKEIKAQQVTQRQPPPK